MAGRGVVEHGLVGHSLVEHPCAHDGARAQLRMTTSARWNSLRSE